MSDRQIPTGPAERYEASEDLLKWMAENFAKFGDIYSANICGSSAYIVGNPRYADHILRENWQSYKKGDSTKRIGFLLGNGLMVSEGDFWKQQRRQIQPAFHSDVIAAAVGIIKSVNLALLEKWLLAARQKSNINVTRDISSMVLEITLRYLFSTDYDKVIPHFEILSSDTARDLRFMQLFRPLRSVVSQIILERRESKKNSADVLGMLMAVRDRESGQAMPDGQIVSEMMTLIVAGHETTASTLAWIWHLLSKHPQVEDKLSAELHSHEADTFSLGDLPKFTYTQQVIEEALRLYPPGWLLIRKALKDDYLGNYFVPAGTEVYISPYLIQRSPSLWVQPDEFDPDRFFPRDDHGRQAPCTIPFSAGPRKCIGEILARVEMQLHIMIVAKRIQLRQVSGDPSNLEAGVNLRCKNEFIMTAAMRDATATDTRNERVFRH